MSILHSKRSGLFIYEQTKIMMKDDKVCFIETKKAKQNFISIPVKNTQCLILTNGCSITSAAVKRLAESGVSLLFASGGGTPVFMSSQDEYRPTEYMQSWCKRFFDEALRLEGAKQLQRVRCDLIERVYGKDFPDVPIKDYLYRYKERIEGAKSNSELLSAEAEFTKVLYALFSHVYGLPGFTRKHAQRNPGDLANSYLDYGNYLAYGMASTCLYALGISYALPMNHGKTRRGALVFDIADIVKDALVLPTAFFSAYAGEADRDFRKRVIEKLRAYKASDLMFDAVKSLCNV